MRKRAVLALGSALLCVGMPRLRAQENQTKSEFGQHRKEIIHEIRDAMNAAKTAKGHCYECNRKVDELCREYNAPETEEKFDRAWVQAADEDHNLDALHEGQQALLHALQSKLNNAAALDSRKTEQVAKDAENTLSALIATDPNDLQLVLDRGRMRVYADEHTEARADFAAVVASPAATTRQKWLAKQFEQAPSLAMHRSLPALKIPLANGKAIDTGDLHGRVLIVDFWASWCPVCRMTTPRFAALVRSYAGRPVEAISISSDTDLRKWHVAMDKLAMTWDQALDTDFHLIGAMGITTIPRYLLADSDGLVLYEGTDPEGLEGPLKTAVGRAEERIQFEKDETARAERAKQAARGPVALPEGSR